MASAGLKTAFTSRKNPCHFFDDILFPPSPFHTLLCAYYTYYVWFALVPEHSLIINNQF